MFFCISLRHSQAAAARCSADASTTLLLLRQSERWEMGDETSSRKYERANRQWIALVFMFAWAHPLLLLLLLLYIAWEQQQQQWLGTHEASLREEMLPVILRYYGLPPSLNNRINVTQTHKKPAVKEERRRRRRRVHRWRDKIFASGMKLVYRTRCRLSLYDMAMVSLCFCYDDNDDDDGN